MKVRKLMKNYHYFDFYANCHNCLTAKGTAHATSEPTNPSFTNVQMNWTAPGAKEWAQKQIGEAKETFFFTASNIVANFTKAVVL